MKHSKITAIVLALCMLVTLLVVPVAAEAENLVADSSFETWGATAEKGSWTVINPANAAGYPSTIAPADTDKTDGNYSLMLKSPEEGASASRKGVYQSIGSFPVGTNIRISLKVKAVKLNDSYARFIVRFVKSDGSEFTNNNRVGEAFPIQKLTAATDGWQTLTVESVLDSCNADKEIRIYFESYSTDFEIYLDDFKAEVVVDDEPDNGGDAPEIGGDEPGEEEVDPAIVKNGDFENGLTGWTQEPKNGTIEMVTEDGNSYVKISDVAGDLAQSWVLQPVSGLDASKRYLLRVDVLSQATEVDRGTGQTDDYKGFAHVDCIDNDFHQEVAMFSQLTTYGRWNRYQTEFTGKTEFNVRLMCYNPVNDTAGGYACFDNVVIEEVVDDGNLIKNGGFDYGRNGLGVYSGRYGITAGTYGYWKFGQYGNSAVFSQSEDAVNGRFSLKVTRTEAEAGAANSVRNNTGLALESGKTYLFSMYVKNVSFADHATNSEGIHIYTANVPTADLVFHAESMPQGEWVCLQWLQTATATGASNFDVRVWGSGVVLIDDVSCYELDKAFATYADADGHYATSLVDGGKATITMPAAAGDAGNAVALAVYSEVEGKKTLKSLKMKMITAEDVTAGYAQFTLAADTLGDFATANYTAKLMTMKNGALVPLQDVILYTEAQ